MNEETPRTVSASVKEEAEESNEVPNGPEKNENEK